MRETLAGADRLAGSRKHEGRIVDKIGVATHRRIFEICESVASMSKTA